MSDKELTDEQRLNYYQRNPPTSLWAAQASKLLDARVKELEALEGRISGLCGPSGNAADDTAYGRVVSALSYQLSRVSELESENAKLREERCGHGWRGSTPEDGKRIATPH